MLGEADLRRATLDRLNRRWSQVPDTTIIEELGTHYGAARIDIAVVNGSLWGYELKSAADRLTRLGTQAEAFSEVFDYVTIVVAEKHAQRCVDVVPDWWGIIRATSNARRTVLTEQRKPRKNPAINPVAVAGLLWRDELRSALAHRRPESSFGAVSRPLLVQLLADELSRSELCSVVRETIRARQGWRDDLARKRYGETLPPERMSSGFLARRVRPQHQRGTGPRD